MKAEDIRKQSESAYKQWAEIWRKHATEFGQSGHQKNNLFDFVNSGVGKGCLLVGNGYSLEENIETIKKNQGKVDIFCCDKTLGHLLKNGIKPDFCMVCDAVVDYEKYLKPYEDQLQDTILFINVCGNSLWWKNGNWKKIYGFVNQDVLKSEREFMGLSGCVNQIPAATNVSGAMTVFVTQSNNQGRNNFFGYDIIGLVGFDYSWRLLGKYYAFDKDGNGKHNYMRHLYCNTVNGDRAFSSTNLIFSARWLDMYIKGFKLPVVQTNKDGIFTTNHFIPLEKLMQYEYKPEDRPVVQKAMQELKALEQKISENRNLVVTIGKDHFREFLSQV